jgi:hypothetical protein
MVAAVTAVRNMTDGERETKTLRSKSRPLGRAERTQVPGVEQDRHWTKEDASHNIDIPACRLKYRRL